MSEIRFEWDDLKAVANKRKHGVSFEEAQSVFYDEYAIEFFDEDHSEIEERFIMVGLSIKIAYFGNITLPKGKRNVIRIISARKATKKESKYYWEERE